MIWRRRWKTWQINSELFLRLLMRFVEFAFCVSFFADSSQFCQHPYWLLLQPLQNLAKVHIDSFNFAIGEGLRYAISVSETGKVRRWMLFSPGGIISPFGYCRISCLNESNWKMDRLLASKFGKLISPNRKYHRRVQIHIAFYRVRFVFGALRWFIDWWSQIVFWPGSIDWLIDWLPGNWLIVRLIDWLIDCFDYIFWQSDVLTSVHE